jgi:hypothetical protein
VVDQSEDGLTGAEEDARKLGCKIGGRKPRMHVAGDICLRRPRPSQGCTADDDNDDRLIVVVHQYDNI